MDDDGGTGASGAGDRTNGGAWIAGSVVALLTGWFIALAAILSTAGPSSSRWSGLQTVFAMVVAFALAFGVPLLGFVALRRQELRGRTVTDVGPIVCLLVMGLGGLSLLPLLVFQGVDVASDAAERAQPPTDSETARTVSAAQEELRALGDRVVAALERDSADPAAEVSTMPCALDNHSPGTMVTYLWRADGGVWASPSPSATVSDQEGTRMSAPAVRLLQDEGYELDQRYVGGGGYLSVTDDWRGSATIGARAEDVLLQSGCLADPDDADDE